MKTDSTSQLTIETRVKDDDVRVVLDRGEQKLGRFLLTNQTICWVPAAAEMTWVMTWEQFSEVMQSIDIGAVVRLSESAYTSASRASAETVKAEAFASVPVPEARKNLGLRRHFNSAEYALIRKGCIASLFIYFDAEQCELRIHRGQSGIFSYALKFRVNDEGAEIHESWTNRVPGEHQKYASVEQEAEYVSWVIDHFLLGKEREMPEVLSL